MSADRLNDALTDCVRYFLVYVNPVMHRTEFQGRSYSESECILCLALSVIGPMRPSGLNRALRIEKGTLTSVIRRLCELGLIERTAVVGDQRGYQVSLTETGQGLIRHLTEQRRSGFRELFAAIPATDADAVARGINLLTTHFRDWEEEHGHLG